MNMTRRGVFTVLPAPVPPRWPVLTCARFRAHRRAPADTTSSETKDSAPFIVAGLKERELTFRNSARLHELYFGNRGGDGKLGSGLVDAAASEFGSIARCEEMLRVTAMGLAGGSGWVVLGWDLHRDALAISWSGGHTHNLAACLPRQSSPARFSDAAIRP